MRNWKYISLFIAALLFTDCNEGYVSSVPSMPVSYRLELTGKYSYLKNSTNQFAVLETPTLVNDRIGYAGLLVYSGIMLDDNANTIYYAFDMACTNEISRDAKVFPVSGELGKVKCNKCGSVFDVSMGLGNPVSGPAKEILRKYKVTVTNSYLYVYR